MKKLTPLVLLVVTIFSCVHHYQPEKTHYDYEPATQSKFFSKQYDFQTEYEGNGNSIVKERKRKEYHRWINFYIDSIKTIKDWVGKVSSINSMDSIAEFKIDCGVIIFRGFVGEKEPLYERLASLKIDSFVQISGLPLRVDEYPEAVGSPTLAFFLGAIKKLPVKE